MSQIRFKSYLAPEKTCYVVADSSSDLFETNWRSDRVITWAAQYDTYGDGMTQHCPLYSISRGQILDFLASLAQHLIACPESYEIVERHWPREWHSSKFREAAKIIYKEPPEGGPYKRQYYSTEDFKVSTSNSKRHDRRWNEVPSWADGSVESIFRLVCPSYFDIVEKFSLYETIREWFAHLSDRHSWAVHPSRYFDLVEPQDNHACYEIGTLFDCITAAVKAHREQDNFGRLWRNFTGNHKPATAEEAAA